MDESLGKRIELFVNNRNAIKKEFKMASPMMHCLCALLLTAQAKSVDASAIDECKEELKKDVKAFSSLRGIGRPALLTQFSIVDDRQSVIDKTKYAYRLLREDGFLGTDYLPLSAFILARNEVDAQLSRRSRELFGQMRDEHKTLTGGDDSSYATLMAVYKLPIGLSCDAFSLLQTRLLFRNETWLMSHILAFDEVNIERNAAKTIKLLDRMKAAKMRFRAVESPILAVLALIGCDVEDAVGQVAQISRELKENKGFSKWQISKGQRQLYSACLYAMEKIGQRTKDTEQRKISYVLIVTMLTTITMATIQIASAAAAQ